MRALEATKLDLPATTLRLKRPPISTRPWKGEECALQDWRHVGGLSEREVYTSVVFYSAAAVFSRVFF